MSALELKIPPVALTVLFAALMWLLAVATPGYPLALLWRLAGFATLVVIGGAIGLASVRSFHRAQTTVNPMNPESTTSLVVSGVYGHSRNPMYLALLLLLLGWGWHLANVFSLLTALAFVPYMNRFQIGPEERALEGTYGAKFAAYRGQVRRWL